MRIDSEQLPQHLERGLKPLYAIQGDEPLLALEAADRIRARAREAGYSEREVLVAETGFDWSRLAECAASLSLFGARRLVDLRIPSGRPGTDGAAALIAYCARLAPDVLTLVSLPKLDQQSQKAKWFGALEQAGVVVSANPVDRSRLPQWIAGRLALQGHRTDPKTLQFIADRVEGNLLAAYQEVQKLALLFPPGALAFDQVRDSVLDVARYDTAKLSEALLAGDVSRFARCLSALRGEGVAPPLVLWQICEEIRTLARVRDGLEAGRPREQVLREARVWGARQGPVLKAVERIGACVLRDAFSYAARIDRIAKGLAPGDPWDELLRLGLDLARPAGQAGGRSMV